MALKGKRDLTVRKGVKGGNVLTLLHHLSVCLESMERQADETQESEAGDSE